MSGMRIYVVDTPEGRRLVRANLRQQAVAYVAAGMITARVASQDDLVSMLSKGVSVESARDPETQELPLE